MNEFKDNLEIDVTFGKYVRKQTGQVVSQTVLCGKSTVYSETLQQTNNKLCSWKYCPSAPFCDNTTSVWVGGFPNYTQGQGDGF